MHQTLRALFSSDRLRTFAAGFVCGFATLVGGSLLLNASPVVPWLVQPLIVAESVEPSDAIVVLGAGLLDGCAPNINAVRRVLLAYRIWKAGIAPRLLFTGGVPAGQPCAVGAVMADMAAEIGVDRNQIFVESGSHSTRENAIFSTPLLRSMGVRRILLVTDRLHVRRAKAAFAKGGFEIDSVSVPTAEGARDNLVLLYYGVREYLALAYYHVRGWV